MNKDSPSPIRSQPPAVLVEEISVPAGHKVFAGHFDGFPIVAGVHQIDWVSAALSRYHGTDVQVVAIPRAKFTAMIRPSAELKLTVTLTAGDSSGKDGNEGEKKRGAKWLLAGMASSDGQKFSEGRLEYVIC